MKNKVLKLCKRLNKITIQEILPILMATESEVTPIIEELQSEGLLENRGDGVYFYKEEIKIIKPIFVETRPKEELNLIIRCFCGKLTALEATFILNSSEEIVGRLFRYFRKIIYEEQLKKLIAHYNNSPQIVRTRKYFNKTVYFYYYDNKTWVAEKPLNSQVKGEKPFPKEKISNFKMDCSKISRRLYLNTQEKYLVHHVAEILWRLDYKNDEDLVNYIHETLNIKKEPLL